MGWSKSGPKRGQNDLFWATFWTPFLRFLTVLELVSIFGPYFVHVLMRLSESGQKVVNFVKFRDFGNLGCQNFMILTCFLMFANHKIPGF